MFKALLISLRPKQWTKNLLIFLALIFTVNQYWRPSDLAITSEFLGRTLLAFILFCIVSSGQYLINDLVDIDNDRNHPTKRHRPLPSGQLQPATAMVAAILLIIVGVGGSFILTPQLGFVALAYLAITVSYSAMLKHLVILDVFAIAAGFVLRAMAGALVIDVPISPWLYICTVLGALFLGFGKRRNELILLNNEASNHRRILDEYTPRLLEDMIAVVMASTVMAYGLYTFTAEGLPKNHSMMLTIPFVLYGIFRYLYLIHSKSLGGSPEDILLKDAPMLVNILLWAGTSLVILMVFRGQ